MRSLEGLRYLLSSANKWGAGMRRMGLVAEDGQNDFAFDEVHCISKKLLLI